MKSKLQIFKTSTESRATSVGLFCLLWALMFLLYLPAASAGFVTDFTGWLREVRNARFLDYINRTHFQARSLYQCTQLITYLLYQLFGSRPWPWHLLFITLHVTNCLLLFHFVTRLLQAAGTAAHNAVLGGVLLFSISPYISEVIVWEPSFHFLLSLLFILIVLTHSQQFLLTGRARYAWQAGLVYFVSTYSLEVFYLTPWFVLFEILFYYFTLGSVKIRLRSALTFLFTPLLLLFAARLILFRILYGSWVSRIGAGAVTNMGISNFGKPAKYLFHLLFLGRFMDDATRQSVYSFCDSAKGVALFYIGAAIAVALIIARFRRMGAKGKVVSLLSLCLLLALGLQIPLWFPEMQLVLFDRYTYLSGGLFYMALALLLSYINKESLLLALVSLFTLANLRFTILVNRYWGKSARIIHNLLYQVPNPGNKILVLLNLPESMNGAPMIGSEKESEYKLMHNLLVPENAFEGPVYDGLSYNMLTPDDGANTTVVNDSTVRVTLNQWGTWWWYEGKGGKSYETVDYRLNMIDGGRFYELTMKKPATNYLLLYQVGDQWKVVDMHRKGVQD